MRLVPDWRRCHTWYSMKGMGAALVIINAWNLLPDKFQDSFPHWTVVALASAALLFGIGGNVVDQSPPPKPPVTVPENKQ